MLSARPLPKSKVEILYHFVNCSERLLNEDKGFGETRFSNLFLIARSRRYKLRPRKGLTKRRRALRRCSQRPCESRCHQSCRIGWNQLQHAGHRVSRWQAWSLLMSLQRKWKCKRLIWKNIHQHRCFCQRQEDKRSRVSGSSWNNEWEDEVLREVAGQWTSTTCGSFSTHVETNWGFIQAFNNHKFIQTLINHFFLPTSWNSLLHLSPFPCRPVQAAANAFMASTRPKKSSKTAAKAKAKANKGTESGTKGKWERGQVGRVHWMDNWFTNEFMILGGLNKWYHLLLIILGLGLQECFFNPTEFVFYPQKQTFKKEHSKNQVTPLWIFNRQPDMLCCLLQVAWDGIQLFDGGP